MPKIKLKEWADRRKLSYITANRQFHAGLIPNAEQLPTGTILVEDDLDQITSAASNDAISLFLKKTVEFSKNNATVEDFAAYVISNFSLKLANNTEGPKYSRQKPKAEDVQKHFQQFIPKSEKPKSNSFIMDPEAFEDIPATNSTVSRVEIDQELVSQFSQAVSNPVSAAPTPGGVAGSMSTEGTVTRSVDLNTTPQPINYTGSNNLAFSSSPLSMPIDNAHVGALLSNYTFQVGVTHNAAANGIDTVASYLPNSSGLYFTNMSSDPDSTGTIGSTDYISSVQPIQQELQSVKTSSDIKLNQPRAKRGRKPSKR